MKINNDKKQNKYILKILITPRKLREIRWPVKFYDQIHLEMQKRTLKNQNE